MKIKTWIKYEESYLPPKCRKLRYKECEDYIDIDLKEIPYNELQLAFEDNSYSGKGKIYFYKGELWSKVKMPNPTLIKGLIDKGENIDTSLDYLKWCHKNCSTFFLNRWDREYKGKDTSREAAIKLVRNSIENMILVNGELYERCSEPRYIIKTFGVGHNHGGTEMFSEYNSNIDNECCFAVTDGELAVAYANKVATVRGDTNDIGKFKPFIKVYMPEIVTKVKNEQTI